MSIFCLFNNQIYGLTKGQYSPTSEENKVTKSTPFGSIDHPFNPLALAMGADATFVARTMDRDPKHLQAMLITSQRSIKELRSLRYTRTATSLMMALLKYLLKKAAKPQETLFLEQGKPLMFGAKMIKELNWMDLHR